MLCQRCHKKVATVHYRETVNGITRDLYFCSSCANLGLGVKTGQAIGIDEILAGLMGLQQNKEELRCPKCNLTYNEFKKIGKVGCEKCYEVFASKLEPVLKQLHGNVQYKGALPKDKLNSTQKENRLKELKEELAARVKAEEYEEAAKIRDMIKEIENKN
ncbi:MAG: UvrB/UvrC motif-containing protein [Clostridiales bacterium]|nr:UvrB/UvrC motif-containing protein [Clostridiales bacterium]